jgi:hypothetical protein
MTELEKRMTTVTGVVFVGRNPGKEPSTEDVPCINIFELDDPVDEMRMRGGKPDYKRSLNVVIEFFIAGSTDAKASKELTAFWELIKQKLYAAPYGLGGLANAVYETGAGRVLRPSVGEHLIGLGMAITIRYIEDATQY